VSAVAPATWVIDMVSARDSGAVAAAAGGNFRQAAGAGRAADPARRSAPPRQGIKRTIPPARNLRASTRRMQSQCCGDRAVVGFDPVAHGARAAPAVSVRLPSAVAHRDPIPRCARRRRPQQRSLRTDIAKKKSAARAGRSQSPRAPRARESAG